MNKLKIGIVEDEMIIAETIAMALGHLQYTISGVVGTYADAILMMENTPPDLMLLDILSSKNELGSKIFSSMFNEGNTTIIFKFLDEKTTFLEDLRVIWKCPKRTFLKALLGRILK